MPRPRVVVAAGCLVIGAAAGAAPAAAQSDDDVGPVFSVSGQRSSTAELTVSRTLRFHVTQDGSDRSFRPTRKGTYVGFAIADSRGRLLAAAVSPADFAMGDWPLLVRIGPTQDAVTLKPGRYRVTFLGDAPGRIDFPLVSGPGGGVSVAGRTRSDVAADWARLDNEPPAAGSAISLPLSQTTLDATARPGHWTSLSTVNATEGPQDDQAWLCMRPVGSPDCSPVDYDYGTQSSTVGTGSATSVADAYFAPGALRPGAYEFGVGWRNIGVRARQAAFVITFRP